jgi:hypothetical protein
MSDERMAEVAKGVKEIKEYIGKPDDPVPYDEFFAHVAWQDMRFMRLLEYLDKIDAWYHLREGVDDGLIRETTFEEILDVEGGAKRDLEELRRKYGYDVEGEAQRADVPDTEQGYQA